MTGLSAVRIRILLSVSLFLLFGHGALSQVQCTNLDASVDGSVVSGNQACTNAGRFASSYCQQLCTAFQSLISTKDASDPNFLLILQLKERPDLLFDANYQAAIKAKAKSDLDQLGKNVEQSALSQVALYANSVQTGSSAQAGGSTNLVTKPTTTDLISLAADSGAFTDTLNGSTMTLSANAEGLAEFIRNENPITARQGAARQLLHRFAFKAGFNVAQPSSTTTVNSTSANSSTPSSITSVVIPFANNLSFNSFTASFSVPLRKADPLSTSFDTAWNAAMTTEKSQIDASVQATQVDIIKVLGKIDRTKLSENIAKARTDFTSAAFMQTQTPQKNFTLFAQEFEVYAEAYMAELQNEDPDLLTEIAQTNSDRAALEDVVRTVMDDARGNLLSVLYSYSSQPSKPATNDVTVAYAYTVPCTTNAKPAGAKPVGASVSTTGTTQSRWCGLQTTANGYGSWYFNVPAGATYGRFRAYQFSLEVDKPIGPTTAPKATVSLAAYGQNQSDPTVLNISAGNLAPGTNIPLPSNAQVLLGKAGWLGVGQAKLVWNLPKANGLQIPIAFKWSSRTDLKSSGDWRGQFGISYDLSALSSLLGGGSGK